MVLYERNPMPKISQNKTFIEEGGGKIKWEELDKSTTKSLYINE
jgi:hypothetical protein